MKPIMFCTEMVEAILDGRKTQTRRVVKPQVISCYKGVYPRPCKVGYVLDPVANSLRCIECGNIIEYSPEGKDYCRTIKPPYRKGDILWVRETWSKDENGEYVYRTNYGATEDDSFPPSMFKWKPSIYMPKDAARIFLKVAGVRAKRLDSMTEEDALAEGVSNLAEFIKLWERLNNKRGYGWNTNPWVWVIEFEREWRRDKMSLPVTYEEDVTPMV